MYRKIPIRINETFVPVVKYFLDDGSEHWAILDTGAQYSILDKSLDGKIENGQEANVVTLSDGEPLKVKRATKNIIFLDVNNNPTRCEIIGFETNLNHVKVAVKNEYAQDIKIDLIVGNNDLYAYQCKIDLKNGYLTIQDKHNN